MSAPQATETKSQGFEPEAATEAGYKEHLDKIAEEVRNPPKPEKKPEVHPVVEKVAQFVPPSVAKTLGIEKKKEEEAPAKDEGPPPGPPERPHHDPQIAEFVRDQHRSRPEDLTAALES